MILNPSRLPNNNQLLFAGSGRKREQVNEMRAVEKEGARRLP
jgi:hypothetical protein